jgi:hypothetical protein
MKEKDKKQRERSYRIYEILIECESLRDAIMLFVITLGLFCTSALNKNKKDILATLAFASLKLNDMIIGIQQEDNNERNNV